MFRLLMLMLTLAVLLLLPAAAMMQDDELPLEFEIVGPIELSEGAIRVDGVIIAPASAFIPAALVDGDWVVVTGILLNDDTLQATSLTRIELLTVTTVLGLDQVVIDGQLVAVTVDTEDAQPGDLVLVTYYLDASGAIIIIRIDAVNPEATPEVTPEATPEVTPEPVADDCARPDHPIALRIASAFAVSYDEVMAHHCAGQGFGNITRAYLLAEESGQDASTYLLLHQSGMGWGQIMRESDVHPSDLAPGRVFNGRGRGGDEDDAGPGGPPDDRGGPPDNPGRGNGNNNPGGGNGNGNGNSGGGNGNGGGRPGG